MIQLRNILPVDIARMMNMGVAILVALLGCFTALSAYVDGSQPDAGQGSAITQLLIPAATAAPSTPTAAPAAALAVEPDLTPTRNALASTSTTIQSEPDPKDPFAHWNDLEPQPW